MFGRVVSALALVMLLLFSATVALACSECGPGTARCPVSLEHRTEEVLDTDLDAELQIELQIVAHNDSDGELANDCEMICDVTDVTDVTGAYGWHLDTKAAGAAGVYCSVVINDNDGDKHGTVSDGIDGIDGREVRNGRFTGAAA